MLFGSHHLSLYGLFGRGRDWASTPAVSRSLLDNKEGSGDDEGSRALLLEREDGLGDGIELAGFNGLAISDDKCG